MSTSCPIRIGDYDDTYYSEIDIAKYSTISDANRNLSTACANDLSIININIVSLPAKMHELQLFLSKLDKKPDMITLSDTKITEKSIIHYIPYLEKYSYFGVTSKTHFVELVFLYVMKYPSKIAETLTVLQRAYMKCYGSTYIVQINDLKKLLLGLFIGTQDLQPFHLSIQKGNALWVI